MCGIVGAVAQRDVAPILIEGLRRLEYRGYDSAGVAVLDPSGVMQRRRVIGKVQGLADSLAQTPIPGGVGIAHTRWATHGAPSERNAHPHVSGDASLALVHNGIIENFAALRAAQIAAGYRFQSDTDTEVIVHALDARLAQGMDLRQALQATLPELKGAYALAIARAQEPERLVVARSGSPLVIGVGIGENFVASDVYALLPVTQRVIFLEEGDVAEITRTSVRVFDHTGCPVEREIKVSGLSVDAVERGEYRHYMLKEIHEQPRAINDTLEGRLLPGGIAPEIFGYGADALFARVRAVQIVACGTSYHAGMIARYWLERYAGLPCQVEVASEFRYRAHAPWPDTLFVTISQSGETADTLAALRLVKGGASEQGYLGTVAICNVPESSLVRESEFCLLTHAGPEIGVASTKAFTTQLTALLLLTLSLQRVHRPQAAGLDRIHDALRGLPSLVERVLKLDQAIQHLAERLNEKHHALFLGRGEHYPVAMEGALKLKEISYIHAEAYPAGELKHGPLALIDEEMPVIAVAPDNALLEKLKSNLEEVRARGGELIVFADSRVHIGDAPAVTVIHLPEVDEILAPIAFTLPLQLLAYYVALLKGTDVDQPRNLAKAVTVE